MSGSRYGDYVIKPVDPQVLVDTIAKWLAEPVGLARDTTNQDKRPLERHFCQRRLATKIDG